MAVYLITYTDEAGDTILPDDENLPRVLYTSVVNAEAVAKKWMAGLDEHRFALYGQAYPYDQTTLEQEVSKKGAGTVGWISFEDEDGDKYSYTIQIVSLRT